MKAYDLVNLDFMFAAMTQLGIPEEYLQMVKPLFADAKASICLNGGETAPFSINHGVCQGCPLAPLLFLFVAEALNAAVKAAQGKGELQGISLSDGLAQQLLVQFADDTNFTLHGTKADLLMTQQILHEFHSASGLIINWPKSLAYWFSALPTPPWLDDFDCPWATLGNLTKLLGIPFGLDLDIVDVDNFLLQKIQSKLDYWTSTMLSLVGRTIIVNSILLSILWYFVTIWARSQGVIRKIIAKLRNYQRLGEDRRIPARVAWIDVCASKTIGGLNIIDPEEALHALTSKWMVWAFEPGDSNLQVLLRHCIFKMQPPGTGI
jgi:hypothetical protein